MTFSLSQLKKIGKVKRKRENTHLVALIHSSYSTILVGRGNKYFQLVWIDLKSSEVKALQELRHLPMYLDEEFESCISSIATHFSDGIDHKTESLLQLSPEELSAIFDLLRVAESVKEYVTKSLINSIFKDFWSSILSRDFNTIKRYTSQLKDSLNRHRDRSWRWDTQYTIIQEIRNKGYASSPLGYIFVWGFPKYTVSKYYYLVTYKGEVFCNHKINPLDWLYMVRRGRLLVSNSKEVNHLPKEVLNNLNKIDPPLAVAVGLKI